MTDFFQTMMGRQYYEGTMPRIAAALERIATVLDDRYMSLAELAAHSGLSRRTLIRSLAASDPLPHFKVGGRVLVRRSDFDVWVQLVGTPVNVERARSLQDKVRRAVNGIRGEAQTEGDR